MRRIGPQKGSKRGERCANDGWRVPKLPDASDLFYIGAATSHWSVPRSTNDTELNRCTTSPWGLLVRHSDDPSQIDQPREEDGLAVRDEA